MPAWLKKWMSAKTKKGGRQLEKITLAQHFMIEQEQLTWSWCVLRLCSALLQLSSKVSFAIGFFCRLFLSFQLLSLGDNSEDGEDYNGHEKDLEIEDTVELGGKVFGEHVGQPLGEVLGEIGGEHDGEALEEAEQAGREDGAEDEEVNLNLVNNQVEGEWDKNFIHFSD